MAAEKFLKIARGIENSCRFLFDTKERRQKRIRKEISDEIDRKLSREEYIEGRTFVVVLFGDRNSGKSTLMRQLQLLYCGGFSKTDEMETAREIKTHIKESVCDIVENMSLLKPPITFGYPDNQEKSDYLATKCGGPDFSEEFFDCVESVWKDSGVQAAFHRGSEFNVSSCIQYFMKKINLVRLQDYVPTQTDILRCPVRNKKIFELVFQNNKSELFKFIDLDYKKISRKIIYPYIDNVNVAIFVVDLSSCDVSSIFDPSVNSLQETLEFFPYLLRSFIKRHARILIILLNKQDLLAEKISGGKTKMEDYFEEYAGYKLPSDAVRSGSEPEEVTKAKYFVRGRIMNALQDHHHYKIYFTSAIDTKSMEKVFEDVFDEIITSYRHCCCLFSCDRNDNVY